MDCADKVCISCLSLSLHYSILWLVSRDDCLYYQLFDLFNQPAIWSFILSVNRHCIPGHLPHSICVAQTLLFKSIFDILRQYDSRVVYLWRGYFPFYAYVLAVCRILVKQIFYQFEGDMVIWIKTKRGCITGKEKHLSPISFQQSSPAEPCAISY